jgi:hypothetical protein
MRVVNLLAMVLTTNAVKTIASMTSDIEEPQTFHDIDPSTSSALTLSRSLAMSSFMPKSTTFGALARPFAGRIAIPVAHGSPTPIPPGGVARDSRKYTDMETLSEQATTLKTVKIQHLRRDTGAAWYGNRLNGTGVQLQLPLDQATQTVTTTITVVVTATPSYPILNCTIAASYPSMAAGTAPPAYPIQNGTITASTTLTIHTTRVITFTSTRPTPKPSSTCNLRRKRKVGSIRRWAQ